MDEEKSKIIEHTCIAQDTYKMRLASSITSAMTPGQFVNIKVNGFSLRRPISISSIEACEYTLVYKVVGDGTQVLSQLQCGDCIDVIGPLGQGFPIHDKQDDILLIGGGVGVPPLLEVAKQYRALSKKVTVVLGFNNADSVFYESEFKSLGCHVYIATMDGSMGCAGTVLDAIQANHITHDFVYACGPMPMLRAVEANYTKGYTSFEARMACGIGACMGCVCKDRNDTDLYYRICKEGPVFEMGKVGL